MSSLSKLTLKGHFEELKSQVNDTLKPRKDALKAEGFSKIENESTEKLLELLIKAVALMEEVYETNHDILTADHVEDYREMILVLNKHGISYRGNTQLLNTTPEQSPSVVIAPKKPMQKAHSKDKKRSGKKAS